MGDVLAVLRLALKDTWDDLWTVLVCNLIWLVCVFLIIPGPPATLALFYLTNRQACGEVVDLADFWHGFRRYFAVSWLWALFNIIVIDILIGDSILTGRLGNNNPGFSNLIYFIQGAYLAVLGAWFLVQVYSLPFLVEQEKPDVLQAFRNGAVMLGRNIGFSLALGLLLILLLVFGTLLFMVIFAIGGFLLASLGNHAVINRLDAQKVSVGHR